ncbi:serine hydroxymethyltransferase, partial [Bacillus cereus]|nr:serine hydroxymethyltransferase [Bacillus cereus]
MDEEAMVKIGKIIAETLKNPKDDTVLSKASQAVGELTDKFPIYPGTQY